MGRKFLCCFFSLICSSSLMAGEVINEDFESGAPPDLSLVGNAQVIDDTCGNQVLSLTTAGNSQRGFAWFPNEFTIIHNRVEVEFDLFIGQGTTTPPADGVSVIFQFDGDLQAQGDAGGGLGVGTFRGNSSPYISVGFDIWDNAGTPDVDIETSCDGAHGAQSSCHVEVDQNIDPENVASQAAVESVDYINRAALYAPSPPGSCAREDLLHVQVIFDNGYMAVKMDGTQVITYATKPFPARPSNLGFAASTGAANAIQWVDNVIVRSVPSKVTFAPEAPRSSGAMNAGGPEIDATGELGFVFQSDQEFGKQLSASGDVDTSLTIVTSSIGRVLKGFDFIYPNPRPINVSKISGADVETSSLLSDGAWSTNSVEYQVVVAPGKYEVKLYFAESWEGAVSSGGQGNRIYNVLVNGTKVLCNWSDAAAAGSATGSGNPFVFCSAVLDTAIVRRFTVNIPESSPGSGSGVLDLVLDDLGGGTPPADPTIGAWSFNRLGATDGSGVGGDLECNTPPTQPAPAGILLGQDFETDADGDCPLGMICNHVGSGTWAAQVQTGRLRTANMGVNDNGTSANFDQLVDVKNAGLEADFDIFMEWIEGQQADGGAFYVVESSNLELLGPHGGQLCIPRDMLGFAVEFDSYGACCWEGHPDPAGPYVHVGINNPSTDSLVTMVQYDPNLKPVANGGTGWPNFLDPGGVHVHVKYNAGHVEVSLSGTQEDGEGGTTTFGPKVVAVADVVPIQLPQAVVGFTGSTGGLNQTIEYDNITIAAKAGQEPTEAEDRTGAALAQARERWATLGELYINCGGPILFCSSNQRPAPEASGDANEGAPVVWVPDNVGAGADPFVGEFFTVSGSQGYPLNFATTDMGQWDARGTSEGVNDNDRVFHTERYGAMLYEIPVANGDYEVILYFANSYSGTAGTARRVYHVDVEGERKGGFTHCAVYGGIAHRNANPFAGKDLLFDPVDEAEHKYSPDPCKFKICGNNNVVVSTDPDSDLTIASFECGNAAAVALRYDVTVSSGAVTVELTPPDAGEVTYPMTFPALDTNPKISGIALRNKGVTVPLQPPVNVAAVAASKQVTVTWSAPASGPAPSGYEVYRDGVKVTDVPATPTTYVDTGLADDTTYCYKLKSKLDVAVSGFSSEACAKTPAGGGGGSFKRGDADGNGQLEITDVIFVLGFQFRGDPATMPCFDASDVDDNGVIDINDPVFLINWLFLAGADIPAPGPRTCGKDPSTDAMPEPCVYTCQ